MEKIYKISEHKYLTIMVCEMPKFTFTIQQMYFENPTAALNGIITDSDSSVGVGLTYNEALIIKTLLDDYFDKMTETTSLFSKIIKGENAT